MSNMDVSRKDSDLDDILDIQLIFEAFKKKRSIKYQHTRMNWKEHVKMLNHINDFEGTYRMSEQSFNALLEGIREDITLSFIHSSQSSSGNDPIYPELILGMCLRFLVGDSVRVLSQLFGVSKDSCRRVIKMALTAIDRTDFKPL